MTIPLSKPYKGDYSLTFSLSLFSYQNSSDFHPRSNITIEDLHRSIDNYIQISNYRRELENLRRLIVGWPKIKDNTKREKRDAETSEISKSIESELYPYSVYLESETNNLTTIEKNSELYCIDKERKWLIDENINYIFGAVRRSKDVMLEYKFQDENDITMFNLMWK